MTNTYKAKAPSEGTAKNEGRQGLPMTESEQFEELFRTHYSDVFAYAVRRCASRQDAEDVAAETFAVAWRRMDELPPGEQARLWLFGTARFVRFNHGRRHDRRLRLVERIRQVASSEPTDDLAGDFSNCYRIRTALGKLPERDREVLQLHAWEELTAEQIGEVLDVSTAAVWKRLQRARDRLAGLLEDEPDSNPTRRQIRAAKEAIR